MGLHPGGVTLAGGDHGAQVLGLGALAGNGVGCVVQAAGEQVGEEIKTIAIFTDRAAIGQELIRCVELYKDEYGFDLVDTIDYSSNATDLSAQVLALKKADPDAILCDSYIGDATLFVQTLKAQNYIPKILYVSCMMGCVP